jgi:HlyD family secretion protein
LTLILAIVVLVAAGGWIAWTNLRSDPQPDTLAHDTAGRTPGKEAGQVRVAALGRLAPVDGVRQIGAPPGERLRQLLVRVGDEVKAGAELAHLDSRPLRQAERDVAEIQLKDAVARIEAEKVVAATTVAEAQVTVEQARLQGLDIGNQEAKVGLAKANYEQVQKELGRLSGLSAELVPPQELEQKRLLEQQVRHELRAATTLLDKLRASTRLAQKAAQAKLDAARANAKLLEASGQIDSLKERLKLSQTLLDQTEIRAPMDGRILDILTRPAEMISQRPILQMADVRQMQVVAEVYETDIGQVQMGQRAVATSPALAAPLTGSVVEIGSVIAQNEVQSLTASTTSAQRVVKVRIQLDDSAAASRLINLQVDVQFLADGGQPAAANDSQ